MLQTVCSTSAVTGIYGEFSAQAQVLSHGSQGAPLWGFSQRNILVLLLIFGTTITKADRSFFDLSKALEQRNDRGYTH